MSQISDIAEPQPSVVSYRLLDQITDLLICSRCFRRNVRRPTRTVISGRCRPLAVCPECSGKAKPGGAARVISLRG
ncbi:MAG: hypothetical protein V2J12_07525 [Gammaproteobacteria bacterium]|jgi:hypothetical protein|nr:hypothetical protein [Gammaproteobacteria bacterium]